MSSNNLLNSMSANMVQNAHGSADLDGKRTSSQNMTECVPVPSSEHVAEIVGRQGCKIKALRAKTNTYIKTPVRGEDPIFVVTGRREDVTSAKREILSAADHFSQIRACRRSNLNGSLAPGPPANVPGHVTLHVEVPYKVVGLVVGPKGATIKKIQQNTNTYIVTPSRDRDPKFEVSGLPDNVQSARKLIEEHIAERTGFNSVEQSPFSVDTLNRFQSLTGTIVPTQTQSLNTMLSSNNGPALNNTGGRNGFSTNSFLNSGLGSHTLNGLSSVGGTSSFSGLNGIARDFTEDLGFSHASNTLNNRGGNCNSTSPLNSFELARNVLAQPFNDPAPSEYTSAQQQLTQTLQQLPSMSNIDMVWPTTSAASRPQTATRSGNTRSPDEGLGSSTNSSNSSPALVESTSTWGKEHSFPSLLNGQYMSSFGGSSRVSPTNPLQHIPEMLSNLTLDGNGFEIGKPFSAAPGSPVGTVSNLVGAEGTAADFGSELSTSQNVVESSKGSSNKRVIAEKCQYCQSPEVEAVFIPCSHTIACMRCANDAKENKEGCRSCGKQITNVVMLASI